MLALFRKTGIHLPQIGDFLAKAGEVFRDIRHHLDDTPLFEAPSLYLSLCRRVNRLFLESRKPLVTRAGITPLFGGSGVLRLPGRHLQVAPSSADARAK